VALGLGRRGTPCTQPAPPPSRVRYGTGTVGGGSWVPWVWPLGRGEEGPGGVQHEVLGRRVEEGVRLDVRQRRPVLCGPKKKASFENGEKNVLEKIAMKKNFSVWVENMNANE